MTHPPPPPLHCVYSLSRYFGRKVQLGPANRQQKLGLVWRNRKKISQIINDYLCLPFFLLIILWFKPSLLVCNQRQRKRILVYKAPDFLASRPNWVPPPPRKRVRLPPRSLRGGGASFASGEGGGRTQFGRLDGKPDTLYIQARITKFIYTI